MRVYCQRHSPSDSPMGNRSKVRTGHRDERVGWSQPTQALEHRAELEMEERTLDGNGEHGHAERSRVAEQVQHGYHGLPPLDRPPPEEERGLLATLVTTPAAMASPTVA